MAQQSKILYLITQSEQGGASRYVFDLATNLKSKGYEIIIAAGGKHELFSNAQNNGIKTYQVKNLVREINPIKDISAYFEIKSLIKKIKPDILHLNSSKAGVLGSLAGKNNVKKIIYTVHGFVFNEPLSSWKKNLYIFAEKFSSKYKNKLICVSEYDRQVGIKNKIADDKKFITIHNGIKNITFLDKQAARQKLNLPNDKIIIGTIANLYRTKGLNYLIEAAKIVTNQIPNVIFRVIGFGDLEKELNDQIKDYNLTDKFIIEKKTDGFKYLKAFNVYAASSVKEGLPYTILEAMLAELPIVATKVGGIPEMINDKNGILVEPKNPQALAQGIIKLLSDNNLAYQLSTQAVKDAEKMFDLEKMIMATESIYQE